MAKRVADLGALIEGFIGTETDRTGEAVSYLSIRRAFEGDHPQQDIDAALIHLRDAKVVREHGVNLGGGSSMRPRGFRTTKYDLTTSPVVPDPEPPAPRRPYTR